MSDFYRQMRSSISKLREHHQDFLRAGGEIMIWRHFIRTRVREDAKNAMGITDNARRHEHVDTYVRGNPQGLDDKNHHRIFTQIEPSIGDLMIRLKGHPQSKTAARRAPHVRYLKVVDSDVRRDADGKLIYTKIKALPDRSGQWSN